MTETIAPQESAQADQYAEVFGEPVHEVQAVYVLATRREKGPELIKAVALARTELARCILELDRVEDMIDAGAKVHSIAQQQAVESAAQAHTRALADLLRGRADSCQPQD